MDAELLADYALANDERRSLFYERPAGELPPHYGVLPGWEQHHTLEATPFNQRGKDERERMKRMDYAGDRPLKYIARPHGMAHLLTTQPETRSSVRIGRLGIL